MMCGVVEALETGREWDLILSGCPVQCERGERRDGTLDGTCAHRYRYNAMKITCSHM